jgi:DNA mismatch repair protein MutS2
MDSHTLELLEFDKTRGLLARYAATSMGKQAAIELAPSVDPSFISSRRSLTTEMTEALSARLSPPFGGLRDVRALARRAVTGAVLEAEELAQVGETLRAVGELDRWLDRIGDQFPRLGGMRRGVGEFAGLSAEIDSCLDRRGEILDTASRKLSAVRREISQAKERIQETLRILLRSPEIRRYLRYANFTMVGHHYTLPVAREHRGQIDGSVQRTSSSNETVYVEPKAIAEQSAQLSFLRARELKEIRRILRGLSAQIGHVADELIATLDRLAELDLIFAQAKFSLDFAMNPADLSDDGRLVLAAARHPLLEAIFRTESRIPPGGETRPTLTIATTIDGEPSKSIEADSQTEAVDSVESKLDRDTIAASLMRRSIDPELSKIPPKRAASDKSVTPIDVHLGNPFSILVITGPNTGGKTVALKTVGLLALMAQSGMHIPARAGSIVPVFDQIFADIGDEQSLEQSLSTFSSHARGIATIVAAATERSLVLLDELGAGTDPVEGAALGRSILDELDSIGCRVIVTTHIGDLKTYAFTNPRAENAAVEFDEETLAPRYRIKIGDVGRSSATAIARRLGLPGRLVDRAERYLLEARGTQAPEWELIQKLRRDAEAARVEAIEAKAEAERVRSALARELADLTRAESDESKLEAARARLKPGDTVVVDRLGRDRPCRVVKIDLKKKNAVVAIGGMQWEVSIAELIPKVPIPADSAEAARRKARGKGRGSIDDYID